MKSIINLIGLVGVVFITSVHASEPKGRVIKVFPQGGVVNQVSIKQDNLPEEKAIKEVKIAASNAALNKTAALNKNNGANKEPIVSLAGSESELTQDLLVKKNPVVDEATAFTYRLSSGLLKPQLQELVRKYLPSYEVYWGNYEGKHEWYGDATIKGNSVEELLNKITSSYGKPPKGITWYVHRNVVEFVYKNSKG